MNLSRARVPRVGVAVAVAAAVGFAGLPAQAAMASPTSVAAAGNVSTVTGIVQDVIVDNPRDGADRDETRRILRVGEKVISLADGSLPAAENGETVRATLAPAADGARRVLSSTTVAEAPSAGDPAGTPSGDTSAEAEGEGAVAAAEDAEQTTVTGTHNIYAAIVRPQGVAADSGLTASAVTTAVKNAASYWTSQTAAKVNFRLVSVAAPYTSAYSCSSYDAEGNMWEEAINKIKPPTGANQHLVIFAARGADNAGCAYGLGSVGTWNGYPGLVFVSDFNQSVVAHELGHNLGLQHSNALRCPAVQDGVYSGGTWSSSCDAEEYGDLFDVMGYSGTAFGEGNLNAVQLRWMGLLPTATRTITTAGTQTVKIAPLSAAATAVRAVRVVESTTGNSYYVEYRTNTLRDAAVTSMASRGVRVLRENPKYSAGGSYVLDATPTGSGSDYTNNLAVGRTFTSASRGLTVSVTAADSTGATLRITNAISLPYRAVMYAMPSVATYGTAVTPRVRVLNAYGQPVANWYVVLQRLSRGATTWAKVATVRTDANGIAAYRLAQGISSRYRFYTLAHAGAPTRISTTAYVTARAAVVLKRPTSSIRVGGSVAVSGAVSRVPSPVVYIQKRKAGGAWGAGIRATVSGATVSGRMKLTTAGKYYIRLYVWPDASGRYVGSYSASYAVYAR